MFTKILRIKTKNLASYWTKHGKVQSKVSKHVKAIINVISSSSHFENNEQDTPDSETEDLYYNTIENIQQHSDSSTGTVENHSVVLNDSNNIDGYLESDEVPALSSSYPHAVDVSDESELSSDSDTSEKEKIN